MVHGMFSTHQAMENGEQLCTYLYKDKKPSCLVNNKHTVVQF